MYTVYTSHTTNLGVSTHDIIKICNIIPMLPTTASQSPPPTAHEGTTSGGHHLCYDPRIT